MIKHRELCCLCVDVFIHDSGICEKLCLILSERAMVVFILGNNGMSEDRRLAIIEVE